MVAKQAAPSDALKQIHYLAAALKTPRIVEAAARLADQARDAGWTHEESMPPAANAAGRLLKPSINGPAGSTANHPSV